MWRAGFSQDRFMACLLLSMSLHGLLLAAPLSPRGSDGGGQMELEVRLAPDPVADFKMQVPYALDYFASLPATLAEPVTPQEPVEAARNVGERAQYLIAAEVDEAAQPMREVQLNYPAHAVAHDLEGQVRLQLWIDETGQVRHLEVLEASPPGIFDEAAMNAFRLVPFAPAKRAGLPVKSQVSIRVDFGRAGE